MVKRTVSLASAPSRSSINAFVTFVAMRSPLSSRRVCPTPAARSASCTDRRLQVTQAGSQVRDIKTSLNGTSGAGLARESTGVGLQPEVPKAKNVSHGLGSPSVLPPCWLAYDTHSLTSDEAASRAD